MPHLNTINNEILHLVHVVSKYNCRIYEAGISYYGRNYAEGKKIYWKDGIRAIGVSEIVF